MKRSIKDSGHYFVEPASVCAQLGWPYGALSTRSNTANLSFSRREPRSQYQESSVPAFVLQACGRVGSSSTRILLCISSLAETPQGGAL